MLLRRWRGRGRRNLPPSEPRLGLPRARLSRHFDCFLPEYRPAPDLRSIRCERSLQLTRAFARGAADLLHTLPRGGEVEAELLESAKIVLREQTCKQLTQQAVAKRRSVQPAAVGTGESGRGE